MKLFLKNSLSSTLLTMLIFLVRNYLQEMEQKKDPFPRQVSVFPGRNVSEQENSKGRCAKAQADTCTSGASTAHTAGTGRKCWAGDTACMLPWPPAP